MFLFRVFSHFLFLLKFSVCPCMSSTFSTNSFNILIIGIWKSLSFRLNICGISKFVSVDCCISWWGRFFFPPFFSGYLSSSSSSTSSSQLPLSPLPYSSSPSSPLLTLVFPFFSARCVGINKERPRQTVLCLEMNRPWLWRLCRSYQQLSKVWFLLYLSVPSKPNGLHFLQ